MNEQQQFRCQSVKVQTIVLEKCWQPKIGEYRPIELLHQDGKDVAILILENPITNMNDAEFPTVFNQIPSAPNIEVYGYPESNLKACHMASGIVHIDEPIDKEWAICNHTASTVKGKKKAL